MLTIFIDGANRTDEVLNNPTLRRRLEGDDEAGLLVFDEVSFEVKGFNGSVLGTMFYEVNLDARTTPVPVEIRWNGVVRFIGIVDLESVSYSDKETIQFTVKDRIVGALDLGRTAPRVAKTMPSCFISNTVVPNQLNFRYAYPPGAVIGDILDVGDAVDVVYANGTRETALMEEQTFYDVEFLPSGAFIVVYRFTTVPNASSLSLTGISSVDEYDKLVLGNNIYNIVVGSSPASLKVGSIKGKDFLEALIKSFDPTATVTGIPSFNLTNYCAAFGHDWEEHPAELLKKLSASLGGYLYCNAQGVYSLKPFSSILTGASLGTISDDVISQWSQKYNWDKRMDGVEITMTTANGDDITGGKMRGVGDGVLEKRVLEKTLYQGVYPTLQDAIDDYFDWYCVRRTQTTLSGKLEWWIDRDLGDVYTWRGIDWVILGLSHDFGNMTTQVEMIKR